MIETTILSLEKQAMERWRNGDPLGFAELGADEIVYIDPGLAAPLIGGGAYRSFMQQLTGQVHYQRSEFIEPRVVVVGDAALLSYNYRSSVLDEAGNVVGQTPWNCTEVYFRQAGQWRIVHSHWSFLQHKMPASLEILLPVQMQPQSAAGVAGELLSLERRAMQRWRQGDPWGFIEISGPEVTYFDTGTPQRINGREALSAEYAKREGKIFSEVMDFIDPRVLVCGDLAVLFYRYLTTWLHSDGSVSHRTPWNCSEVFVRFNGEWKITHTHWSFIRGERF